MGKRRFRYGRRVEIAREVSLKVEEQPNVPVQPQVGNVRETSLKAEEHSKVSLPPLVDTARDIGTKVGEQKKDQVHPRAKVGVAAGLRPCSR